MYMEAGITPGWRATKVFDARTGLQLVDVVWASDESHSIGRHRLPDLSIIVEHVPKVVFILELGSILINVRELDDEMKAEQAIGSKVPDLVE